MQVQRIISNQYDFLIYFLSNFGTQRKVRLEVHVILTL